MLKPANQAVLLYLACFFVTLVSFLIGFPSSHFPPYTYLFNLFIVLSWPNLFVAIYCALTNSTTKHYAFRKGICSGEPDKLGASAHGLLSAMVILLLVFLPYFFTGVILSPLSIIAAILAIVGAIVYADQ